MSARRLRYSASWNPGWSASSSPPQSSVLCENRSRSAGDRGNQIRSPWPRTRTLTTHSRARRAVSKATSLSASGTPSTSFSMSYSFAETVDGRDVMRLRLIC
eukprot:Amastigsp_a841147_405.p4 type:complete len:102 gc:universal Amastigsp_a841147_405:470-165(-)